MTTLSTYFAYGAVANPDVSFNAPLKDCLTAENENLEKALGSFETLGTVAQTLGLCRNELLKANFNVTQLGEHRLLGCKKSSKDIFIELTVERTEEMGCIVTYNLHN